MQNVRHSREKNAAASESDGGSSRGRGMGREDGAKENKTGGARDVEKWNGLREKAYLHQQKQWEQEREQWQIGSVGSMTEKDGNARRRRGGGRRRIGRGRGRIGRERTRRTRPPLLAVPASALMLIMTISAYQAHPPPLPPLLGHAEALVQKLSLQRHRGRCRRRKRDGSKDCFRHIHAHCLCSRVLTVFC